MASRSYHGHFTALMLTVQKLHVKAISPNHKSENIQAVLLTHMNSFDLSSSSTREVRPLDAYDQ
jgi:hypothetical protein